MSNTQVTITLELNSGLTESTIKRQFKEQYPEAIEEITVCKK